MLVKQVFVRALIRPWLLLNKSRYFCSNRAPISNLFRRGTSLTYYQIRGSKIYNDGHELIGTTSEVVAISIVFAMLVSLCLNWLYLAELFGIKITVREESESCSKIKARIFEPYADEAYELFRGDDKIYYRNNGEIALPPGKTNNEDDTQKIAVKSDSDGFVNGK